MWPATITTGWNIKYSFLRSNTSGKMITISRMHMVLPTAAQVMELKALEK